MLWNVCLYIYIYIARVVVIDLKRRLGDFVSISTRPPLPARCAASLGRASHGAICRRRGLRRRRALAVHRHVQTPATSHRGTKTSVSVALEHVCGFDGAPGRSPHRRQRTAAPACFYFATTGQIHLTPWRASADTGIATSATTTTPTFHAIAGAATPLRRLRCYELSRNVQNQTTASTSRVGRRRKGKERAARMAAVNIRRKGMQSRGGPHRRPHSSPTRRLPLRGSR